MVTGADKSGYYNFVEVVFMKEKKEYFKSAEKGERSGLKI